MSEREISVDVAGCGPLTFVDLQERADRFDDDLLENIAYVRRASTMARPDPNTRGVGMSGRWFEVLAGAAERGIAQRRELAAALGWEDGALPRWTDLTDHVRRLQEKNAGSGRAVLARHGVTFRTDQERYLEEDATAVRAARESLADRAKRLEVSGKAEHDRAELLQRSLTDVANVLGTEPSAVLSRVSALKNAEDALRDVAQQLECYPTAPGILDAVTRMQEDNARLTSEQAGPLAVMRQQAERAHAELIGMQNAIYAAIDRGSRGKWRRPTKPGDALEVVRDLAEQWADATSERHRAEDARVREEEIREAVFSAIEAATGQEWRRPEHDDSLSDLGMLLDAVRELGTAWRQARTDAVDATRELYFSKQENAELKAEMVRDLDPVAVHEAAQVLAGSNEPEPDDVCRECGEATCEQCGLCHECRRPCQRAAPPERATVSPGLAAALASVATVMATSTRDWSASAGDAWLYGIVIGWGEALEDVADAMRWPHEVTVQLCALNRAVAEAMTPAVER